MDRNTKSPHPIRNVIGPFPDEGILTLLDQFLVKLGFDLLMINKLMVCAPTNCSEMTELEKKSGCSSSTSLKECRDKKSQNKKCSKSSKCQCCKCQCSCCCEPKLCETKCYTCMNLIPPPAQKQSTTIKCEPKCQPKKNEKGCCGTCFEKIASILKCKPKSEEESEKKPKCACKIRPVQSQWALTKINVFNDNSKTFEIMDMKSSPPPTLVPKNPKMLLAVTRNGTAYVFDGIHEGNCTSS